MILFERDGLGGCPTAVQTCGSSTRHLEFRSAKAHPVLSPEVGQEEGVGGLWAAQLREVAGARPTAQRLWVRRIVILHRLCVVGLRHVDERPIGTVVTSGWDACITLNFNRCWLRMVPLQQVFQLETRRELMCVSSPLDMCAAFPSSVALMQLVSSAQARALWALRAQAAKTSFAHVLSGADPMARWQPSSLMTHGFHAQRTQPGLVKEHVPRSAPCSQWTVPGSRPCPPPTLRASARLPPSPCLPLSSPQDGPAVEREEQLCRGLFCL